MNDELTIEELEDELIAKALKDASFSRPMPSGMADRLRVRIRETVAPRRAMPRWFKIAASLAAVASFAALAATVTQLVAPAKTAEEIEVLKKLETPDDLDTLNQTFEEIFSEELNEITQQEEQKMNSKAIRSIAAGTFAFAATSLAAPSVHGAVRSSVFDDVKVWYKGSAGNAVGSTVYQQTAQQLAGQLHGILSEKQMVHNDLYYDSAGNLQLVMHCLASKRHINDGTTADA